MRRQIKQAIKVQYIEWTSCSTISDGLIHFKCSTAWAIYRCIAIYLSSSLLDGYLVWVCVLVSWIAYWPFHPLPSPPCVWVWAIFPIYQEAKHLLKLLLLLFTYCVDKWHINSPLSLPILCRAIFLIRQTYLTQYVFILLCLFFKKCMFTESAAE